MPRRSPVKPTSKKKSAPRKRRGATARRGPARRSRVLWSWLLIAAIVFVAANPKARAIAWEALLASRAVLESAQAAKAAERQADEYARRYGIEPTLASAILKAAHAEG
ncbi:MAG TPA: hypothetical protein VF710_17700, partial [Longimicrobium sp.]